MATLIGGNLDDTLPGGLAADLISGLGGNDSLTGNEGDDTLNGGKGADTLVGGVGNDTYVVDSAADVIVETGGDLRDHIQSSVSIDLNNGAYKGIEHVTLLGAAGLSAFGNAGANLLVGNAGANKLDGGDGEDTMIGGAGADLLVGGVHNDTYVVNSAADKISELGGDADDRILASIAIDLNNAAYDGIEHITLSGVAALSATGDDGANMLIGNAAANKLDGGKGVDTLIGGAGNDVYKMDSSDLAIEYAGEGTDTVISTENVGALGAYIENLVLVPGASIATGNTLANVITGSAASDIINGHAGNDTLIGNDGSDQLDGSSGADNMVGGKGGDIYSVNEAGDKVLESGPAGEVDTINSVISYTLGANLERLQLLVEDDIGGTGNTLANFIIGNKGANVLSGLAGDDALNGDLGQDLLLGGDGNDQLSAHAGTDTLVGGAGSDTFHFGGSWVLDGVDMIADLDGLPNGDKINFSSLLLSNFVLPASDFLQTVTANGSTTILVDSNGTVGGAAFIPMAVLQGVSTDLDGLLANSAITLDFNLIVPMTPPIDGTAGGDNKVGTGISDLIRGLGGNDTLSGSDGFDTLDGGAGNDSLIGGSDSDTYIVNSAGDKIDESGGGTDDRIIASIAIDLNNAAYAGIEHATLAGVAALSAFGNGGANMLIGNAATNKLDGRAGLDTLIGGAGNDIYFADDIADLAVENPGEGTDTVIATGLIEGFTLGANIENLTVASDVVDGFEGNGNALANKITGNKNDESLDGKDGNDFLIGNDGNDGLDGGVGADTLIGGKEGDSYFVDNIGDKVIEAGPVGEFDQIFSTVTYVLGANLEGLFLSGGDNINGTGNSLNNEMEGNFADNVLSGLAGNDTLELGQGTDTLVGGVGSDEFRFTDKNLNGLDVIADFNGLPGGDKLNASPLIGPLLAGSEAEFIQTVVANGSTLVRLDLDGNGSAFGFVDAAVLQGVSTDLAGLLANGSILNVGTGAAPPIDGTAGADNKVGTGGSDLIRGLGGNDTLTGDAGFDTLDGGAGADSLIGGSESDTYVVNSAADKIDESGGGTDDRIVASIAIDLSNAAYAGIEHVTLTGMAALSASGNSGANMLIGNVAANKLDGRGGIDTLIGGAGNDIYLVNHVDDLALENPGEGIDTVMSAVNGYTLGAYVENLTMTGVATVGTGNALANKITGNALGNQPGIELGNKLDGGAGNDFLIGNNDNDELIGGAGADTMVGGKGADTYFVDNIGDKVVETGGAAEDGDAVSSSITYTLGASLDVLLLSGGDNIDGTGNSLNNEVHGNSGNNALRGLAGSDILSGNSGDDMMLGGDGNDFLDGGEGADTLVGGAGSDRFRFSDVTLSGLDVVADFNGLPGGDVIDVGFLLTGFTPGVSDVNDFLKTSTANGSTTIQVDVDGTVGGANFVDMAVLQGVSTSIDGLLANGSLLLVS